MYPEFYAQRKKLLKKQAKNLVRLAKLKIEGVTDFDDLMTQYLAETGRLDVGPLNHILNPEQGNEGGIARQQMKFQRGLLSPFRVFGDEAVSKPQQGVMERGIQSSLFETRQDTAEARNLRKLGVDGVGFAPTGKVGDNEVQRQGDKQWWQVLNQE